MTSKVFKKNRKGAEPNAGNATIMVLIVAGAIIVYLLGIPPAERAELLDENGQISGPNVGGSSVSSNNKILLEENIGRLTKMPFNEKEHDMSAIRVDSTTNAESVYSKESLYVRNSVFTKTFPEINFEVNPELSDNLKLSFNLKKAAGVLSIFLNGYEIFSGEMLYTSPPAINLPKEYVKENNKLSFYLYRPTWAIWKINEYEITNLNILGDITDMSRSAASVTFALSDIEYESLDEATLFFLPDCDPNEVGKLNVFLNNRRIYSAVPDCGVQNYIHVDRMDLNSAKNSVGFKTEKGQFLVDQIRLKTKLEDTVYPVYYFDLQDYHFFSDSNDDEDKDYKYFCDIDKHSILLEYNGNIEETGWSCDSDENCLGNFKFYSSEKSESSVKRSLCEELDEDEFKYVCGEDDESIFLKKMIQVSEYEYVSELSDTGWECSSGRTCKENEEIYDHERLEDIVLDDLCEYQDEDDQNDYFGDYELKDIYDIEVTLRFPNNNYKELTVWVNGYRREVSTTKSSYEFQIDPYVFSGSNSIELVPRTNEVSVTEMKVELIEN